MPQEYTIQQLETLINTAVCNFLADDEILLETEGSEWSIAHRIAVYLEPMFPGWNIDCEYNRQGADRQPKSGNVSKSGRCRPDIIIHHRTEKDLKHNLLVVEIKKAEDPEDFERAKDYSAPPKGDRNYQYQFGLAISFNPLKKTWFTNGEQRVPE